MRSLPQSAKSQGKKRVCTDLMDEKKLTITIKSKGKAKDESPPSPTPEDRPRIKKPKRAETRPCPICDEPIPLRLMARHAQLETERVDEIIKQVGSSEPILLADEFEDLSRPGPSTGARSRRSAIKAMKSFATSSMSSATNEQVTKTVQTIQRHRKQRHARFKEMAREEEEGYSERSRWARRTEATSDEVMCPVCSRGVRGDQEVIDAHVNSCLADESRRLEEERARRVAQESIVVDDDWGGDYDVVLPDGAAGHVGNVRGTGFHTHDPTNRDVEDEVDIDGDDQDTYGEAQFTEGDILPVDEGNHTLESEEDVEINIDGDLPDNSATAHMSLRDLIVEGRVIQRHRQQVETSNHSEVEAQVNEILGVSDAEKLDSSILQAKRRGDQKAIVAALENKIKQLVLPLLLTLNRYGCHPQPPCSVAYVWTLTTSPPSRPVVGTPAAGNAGYAVWDLLSSVRYAS
ncbi:hypothetical protein D9756_000208 [Leucocoprinus leucothites]|uniref:E3 ubiquitin-protein ligase RNF220 middle domain-containing protein n=1 Tax=Leucocoprinus leucothites TaxID=201217 RepID=A0A8H5GE75_9AGAR|nr:hypothetical protein D9756_000208 [Leucoagaricus leucothites]